MSMRVIAFLENNKNAIRVDVRQSGNYIVLDSEISECIMLYMDGHNGLALEFDTVDGQQHKFIVGDLADLDIMTEE